MIAQADRQLTATRDYVIRLHLKTACLTQSKAFLLDSDATAIAIQLPISPPLCHSVTSFRWLSLLNASKLHTRAGRGLHFDVPTRVASSPYLLQLSVRGNDTAADVIERPHRNHPPGDAGNYDSNV